MNGNGVAESSLRCTQARPRGESAIFGLTNKRCLLLPSCKRDFRSKVAENNDNNTLYLPLVRKIANANEGQRYAIYNVRN